MEIFLIAALVWVYLIGAYLIKYQLHGDEPDPREWTWDAPELLTVVTWPVTSTVLFGALAAVTLWGKIRG